MSERVKASTSVLFPYLLFLTIIFLFLETCFFIQWTRYYLGGYQVVAHHLSVPKLAIPGIVYFIFIQLIIHFLYAVVIWSMARLTGVAWTLPWKQVEKMGFSLWVIGLIAILLANQYFFPNSKFSYIVSVLIPPKVGIVLFIILAFTLLVALITAMIGLFRFSRILFMMLVMIIVVGVVYNKGFKQSLIINNAVQDSPNIILIGIDSLRPDFLGYFSTKKLTPHIDDFLNQSYVFTHALTPLARTFPAWVSILTGQYPKHNGMRTNLSDQSKLDLSNTLPAILRKQGYETIFASDESRFSNIDHQFGFDQVIVPPMGFNDFLLGTLNDFPLSNLMINTRWGAYLFPYSYANRGVFTAYDPNTFLRVLQTTFNQTHHRPLFLAVHFCLPHFPYFWGNNRAHELSILNYQSALQRVDQQFNDFLAMLAKHQLLDHSIIVLLSDHGEAIELSGDRVTQANLFIPGSKNKLKKIPHFYPRSMDSELIDQSTGHGTDVLGLTQYQVLLAFRITPSHTPGLSIPHWVSLLDIKPTLLAFLKLKNEKTDGGSLVNLMTQKQVRSAFQQDLFIESDFSPRAVLSVHPEIQTVLFEGIDYFQIDSTTARIIVKENMMKLILSSKQYADFYQNWILALYPQNKKEMMPILVNLKTGQWTNDLGTAFSKNSPAKHMLAALKHFYGNDITLVLNA